jgi:hypothetical protein
MLRPAFGSIITRWPTSTASTPSSRLAFRAFYAFIIVTPFIFRSGYIIRLGRYMRYIFLSNQCFILFFSKLALAWLVGR